VTRYATHANSRVRPLCYPTRMTRLARAIVPGLPHHVTQRGNRRQPTFFSSEDYLLYMALMGESCRRYRVDIWAYCLMPNHVHLIAVPLTLDGLRRAIGEAHRRYTLQINGQREWRGYLWQGRFSSFVMDDRYAIAAARYIELNPVRAQLVSRAEDYPWSSARAHLLGRDDALVTAAPLLARVPEWRTFLGAEVKTDDGKKFRRHETTGRPLGAEAFVSHVENLLGRVLRPRRPGPIAAGGTRLPVSP
jgi:REP-associated tyrosine transposase